MANEIKPRIRQIADELKSSLQIDSTGKITIEQKDDMWDKHLSEGITMDMVKKVQEDIMDAAAGFTLAVGEYSQNTMKDNKELESTSARVTFGYSAFENEFTRHRKGAVKGVAWEKFGVASTDIVLGAGRKSRDYRNVVNYLEETSKSIFQN